MRRSAPELTPRRVDGPKLGRAAAVSAITVALVLVFGGLFAAADPAFAHLIGNVVPSFALGDVVARVLVFGVVAAFVLGGGYLLRFPPRLDALAPAPMRPVPRWEWAVPLGVLNAVFLAFVAVQATVLFGGHRHVLETEGLTYAEYARQGFWQLLWVSALTLLVLSVVVRVAGRATAADRRLVRVLVGTTCATSVVVVISAIHRMWLYQQAYGFSVQRLMVIAIELWLGAVFVLIAVAGIRMTARWLPHAVLVTGVLTLLGVAAMNPERFIAEHNVDRFEQTGLLDSDYLLSLSPDIEPALQRLPEPMRVCARYRNEKPDPWYEFNLSRSQASHEGTPAGDAVRSSGGTTSDARPALAKQALGRYADPVDKAPVSRRDELLDLAATMFAERGLRATTVRDIADSAGILSGSLYHHFKSKEQMVEEVLVDFLDWLFGRYQEIVDNEPDPLARVSGLFMVSFEAIEDRHAQVVIYQDEAKRLSSLPQFGFVDARNREQRKMWVDVLKQGMAQGCFRPDLDVDLVYRFIRDTTWVSVRWYQPGGPLTAHEVGQQYLAIVLGGITSEGV